MTDQNLYKSEKVADWITEAFQLIGVGRWEETITLWIQQVPFRTLSLWLLIRIHDKVKPICMPLLEEMQSWYSQPNESLRWQIFHHAEILGFDTPEGLLALSLFWSEGSMSPEGMEPIYPDPHSSREMLKCVLLMLVPLYSDVPTEGMKYLLDLWINREKT